jgi:hypothetical protein
MRKTLIAFAAAGALLVGACGDSGGDDEEGAGSDDSATTEPSVPEQTGPHAQFCTELMSAPAEGATAGMPDIEAPAEIAEAYDLMRQAGELTTQIDQTAPDATQQMEAAMEELGGQEAVNEAQAALTNFVMTNCNTGMEAPPDASSTTAAG